MSVVLITGVAGRVGRATARRFADSGWAVIGVDIKPCDDIDGVELDHADMSNDAEVRTLMRRIAATQGRLDALVNNASVQVSKPILETSGDEFDITMAVNVKAAWLAIKHGISLLASRPGLAGGAVINVGSVHGVASAANQAAFAASNGALLALTRSLSVELAPSNIRVNAVLRGAIGGSSPSGRTGAPADVAAAIHFLADAKQSAFVTGTQLVVDGGALSRLND